MTKLILVLTLFCAILGSGCATNGRYILLKEFGPTGPSSSEPSLKNVSVCLTGFKMGRNLTSPNPSSNAEQIADFKFVDYTKEQKESWDQEFRSLEDKEVDKPNWKDIGYVRNGFGMTLSHVYAMNDAGTWLEKTLAMDLQAQGAKIVDAKNADVCLGGTIQFLRVDAYMKVWADLVVDLDVSRNGQVKHALLHTNGSGISWVAGTYEFYKPIRESRQKFSYLVTREILATLKVSRL